MDREKLNSIISEMMQDLGRLVKGYERTASIFNSEAHFLKCYLYSLQNKIDDIKYMVVEGEKQ